MSRDGSSPYLRSSFYRVISEAIADLTKHGFDSVQRLEQWAARIRRAAIETMTPMHTLDAELRATLGLVYQRDIQNGGMFKHHAGVSRFTIEKVRPQLRAELDRRIMANADLIKLNREQAIEQTLRRFKGWATSIPDGGSRVVDRQDTKDSIRKALVSLPFEERRVIIDQGHKLSASLSEIMATDGGAIAAVWHSRFRQRGYNFRPDHKERDDKVYLIRGSWAQKDGLVKAGPAGYTDQITRPAQEPFCRCYYTWVYNLRSLPDDMLTEKGRRALADARARMAA